MSCLIQTGGLLKTSPVNLQYVAETVSNLLNKPKQTKTEVNLIMKSIKDKLNDLSISSSSLKLELDNINEDIETLNSKLNNKTINLFKSNVTSLMSKVETNLTLCTTKLEKKRNIKEKLNKQLGEQEELIMEINKIDFNGDQTDDELMLQILNSNIDLDSLFEDEINTPRVSPEIPEIPEIAIPNSSSNVKTINHEIIEFEGERYIKTAGILEICEEAQEETKQYEADIAFNDKAADIEDKEITDDDRANIAIAFANSPSVETVETPVKPSNVSPSNVSPSFISEENSKNTIEIIKTRIGKGTNVPMKDYVESLYKQILTKERISNLEDAFMTKLKTCILEEQMLRLEYRYYFGPVNYILDNLSSNNRMITGELHSKLIEIAKANKCAEGLTFLLDNFSEYIYNNYIEDLQKAISYIETDIPF